MKGKILKYCIYKITNNINDMSYIGQHIVKKECSLKNLKQRKRRNPSKYLEVIPENKIISTKGE